MTTKMDWARGRYGRLELVSGTAVLVLVAIVFAFPIVWSTLSSFKSTDSIAATRYPLSIWSFLPPAPTLENYGYLFGQLGFQINLANTLIVSFCQVTLSVMASTVAGYAFGRLRFPGRDLLFALALASTFAPLEVILTPLYQVVTGLGLASTYAGLFLPFVSQPFGIFLMRQSFMQIPNELDEAARMDGATVWQLFWMIALPNVRPALATLVLIQFIWSWNIYAWPLVIMQDPSKQVAQVALASMRSSQNFPMDGPIFAGITVMTIPLVILALTLQKYYVRGLMASGIK
jgi:ABC-type glycerol-3-phosphate transport system permease component